MELDAATYVVLALAAVAASFVDAIAGGGGLITLPALLVAGVPPLEAIATNKSQAVFGTGVAAGTVVQRGLVDRHGLRARFVASAAGSAVGAVLIQHVDQAQFELIVPAVLAGIAAYMLFARPSQQQRVGSALFDFGVVPVIGCYDGFFGPGTGSFFAVGGSALRGMDLLRSSAQAKVLNLASNLAALTIFVGAGVVHWQVTVVMVCGQAVGATLGTRVMIQRGASIIRPLVVVVCTIMIVRWFAGR